MMETVYEQTSFLEPTEKTAANEYNKPYSERQYPRYQKKPRYENNKVNYSGRAYGPIRSSSKPTEQTEPYVRRTLPNKAFDQEYMTEWAREVKFLADKGIYYTYVKRTPDYGISQFKYKKTPILFEALKEFYSIVETEKANLASTDEVQEVLKGAGITIQRGRNGAIKFVKDERSSDTEDVTE